MTHDAALNQEHLQPKRRPGRLAGTVNRAKSDRVFLITEEDVAERIGLNIAGVRLLRASDEGPTAIKLGSQYFYRVAEVDAWIGATPV